MKLVSEQTWCLSGTPIFNGLWDLFPVFNLIDMPRLKNADVYRNLVGSVNSGASVTPRAANTVQVALRAAMMRRTKEDQFMGKPLIELPPKELEEVFIDFDPDSRALYDVYESMARRAINAFSEVSPLVIYQHHAKQFIARSNRKEDVPYLGSLVAVAPAM
jgi:SNF2 family DNA or RNA helicase